MRLPISCFSRPAAGWLVVACAGFSLLLGAEGTTALGQTGSAQGTQATRQRRPARTRVIKRRDPFRSLLVRAEEAEGRPLPPGKRGLVIARLRVNGLVFTPEGSIAVVTMRGRNRAYFLREGDELFDGYVGRITEAGVVFKERAVDAFGKQYERDIVKQLSGSGA